MLRGCFVHYLRFAILCSSYVHVIRFSRLLFSSTFVLLPPFVANFTMCECCTYIRLCVCHAANYENMLDETYCWGGSYRAMAIEKRYVEWVQKPLNINAFMIHNVQRHASPVERNMYIHTSSKKKARSRMTIVQLGPFHDNNYSSKTSRTQLTDDLIQQHDHAVP